MARFQLDQISKKERYEMIGNLYEIVGKLKTKKDIMDFFMGLFTPSEALMFARRIQIAEMLLDEEISYNEIKEELGVGDSTIANVARWIYDDNSSFRSQIEQHKKRKEARRKIKEKKSQGQHYGNLLNKYPQHRILRNLFGL